jgi:DNA-directed RNA polymerase omega subunit
VERAPKQNRFEFVVVAGQRARQLLKGAEPREEGEKTTTIAQREVLRLRVQKVSAETIESE